MLSFTIKSGKVRVTDPCYKPDTWCAGTIENVAKGRWFCNVETEHQGQWGLRQMRIFAWHDKVPMPTTDELWVDSDIDVGVDSGQAGFFDAEYFNQHHGGEYDDKASFYGKCCATTAHPGHGWGVIDDSGVVSSSAFGDGSYRCFTITNEMGVVALYLEFGDDEEGDDDDDA
jgi:hypothetical protein